MMAQHAERSEFLEKLSEAQTAAAPTASKLKPGNEVMQDEWWHVPATTGACQNGGLTHDADEVNHFGFLSSAAPASWIQ